MKSIRYSDSDIEVNMLLCVIKIPALVTRGRTQGQLTNTLEAVRDRVQEMAAVIPRVSYHPIPRLPGRSTADPAQIAG